MLSGGYRVDNHVTRAFSANQDSTNNNLPCGRPGNWPPCLANNIKHGNRMNDWHSNRMNDRHSNRMKYWYSNRMNDWHSKRMNEWYSNRMKDWHSNRMNDWHSNKMNDWNNYRMKERQSNRMKDLYSNRIKDLYSNNSSAQNPMLQRQYIFMNSANYGQFIITLFVIFQTHTDCFANLSVSLSVSERNVILSFF